jgi:rifampicin phosphotransferase
VTTTAGAPTLVLRLDDPAADLARSGGKGASLARLASAGLPVPAGFHVTTEAYREFVASNDLQARILATLEASPDADSAARVIRDLFAGGTVPPAVADAIRTAYAKLGSADTAVAVRSSATAEDLPGMSFAGQQDTYLNVRGEADVLDAVRRCWASLWTARAITYRARHHIAPADVALAVVVQELVPADAAGVMFTVNPIPGGAVEPDGASEHAREGTIGEDAIVINAAWGLGEAVVGGQVTPDTYTVDRSTGEIDRYVADKTVMTVRTSGGTQDQPVPADLRAVPVLTTTQVHTLADLGRRIEELYGTPMDVEWALDDDRLFILQARPITGRNDPQPALEEWNDSPGGDYLWTCANLGEAISSVMTPATWSLVRIFMSETMSLSSIGPHRISGTIGGRFYLNLSVMFAVASALGLDTLMRHASEQAFGRLPDEIEIPPLPMSRWRVVRESVRSIVPFLLRVRRYQRRLPELVAGFRGRCTSARARIEATTEPVALADLWTTELDPLLRDASRMLAAGARLDGAGLVRIRPVLRKLVGEADTSALLTGLHSHADGLASLGPLLGLGQLARGEIDRETYAELWGHRCPDEFEVSVPRPAEDPAWIDRQLAGLRDATHDATALLARQEEASSAAWERFRSRFPRRERALRRRIERAGAAARAREAARSEVIRTFWVLRTFLLRAGTLTGHGERLFQLSIEETLALLRGDDSPLARVPSRQRTYAHYRALPAYPTLIRGAFDPVRWAADPDRRHDVFDATRQPAPIGTAIIGFPGAAGVIEGVARVLGSAEEGDQLGPGEILVTSVTNVGWTPLFPRAGAVVTDIGAPLSHAAIVARELGIPAVVGCGNATFRIRSGDRIRVDGERGTVDILRTAG